uniref:GTPase activating protein (SH3 domain) binding protein 1 n=1 Tax=Labrus bergylta TaxID=56723 RepID=A0A3Q3EHZ1_9LABR
GEMHKSDNPESHIIHPGWSNVNFFISQEIHKRVMALSFRDCHTNRHGTWRAWWCMGELSNNMQPMRKFMQTFVLAPEGTVANKFYVHNDVFRYQDEVFADSDSEPPEDVFCLFVKQHKETGLCVTVSCFFPSSSEPTVPGDEEEAAAASPEPEPEVEKEVEAAVVELKQESMIETQTDSNTTDDQTEKSPAAAPPTVEPVTMPPFSWASVTSKNLPPSGAVPVSGMPPHVVKAIPTAPRVEVKPESQTATQRPQRDQRPREQRPGGPPPVHRGPRPGTHVCSETHLTTFREGEQGESEGRRVVRYPDAHQLFVGNVPHDVDRAELKEFFEQYGTVLELRINSGGKLPNFGFVVFDDSEPVQKILSNRLVKINYDTEKKTRSAREGDRRDVRPRGPGGPGGPRERIGGGGGPRGPPTRGGMAQKPSFGSGRGAGPNEGRYSAPRQ